MTDKLSIYNGALNILGERKLASETENREPRYQLDDIWDNDMVDRCLQMGQWNFAARSVQLEASPSVTPSFGYQYGFDKPPTDFIRTMMVCYDEYFDRPITRYSDEGQWIFADVEVIYLKYVSNDSQFGGDFSLWPPNFTEFVEHYLAYKVQPRLTGLDYREINSTGMSTMEAKFERSLLKAKSTDAMEGPAKFAPKGGWANSRGGYRSGDRGKRGQLIG
jgi:hypothetical protein